VSIEAARVRRKEPRVKARDSARTLRYRPPMSPSVTELLADPMLPEVVSNLQAKLRIERELREKFYEEITPDMKAEFINGQVIMHSPATALHTETRMRVTNLLSNYVHFRSLGMIFDEKTLCTFPRNDYEPDVIFFAKAKAAKIKPDTWQFPPPDFACEVISPSTESRDRGVKFRDYEAHGVQEYWIVDPKKRILEQYVLIRGRRYELRLKAGTGEVSSVAIKGLKLPIRALFDAKTHRAALKEMLA
jgi:Uma2 family endonuclease